MHKWFRKAIAVVLAGALVMTCAPLEAIAADSGTGAAPTSTAASARAATLPAQGDGWYLDTDGTLTLENDEGMKDWRNQSSISRLDVKTVVLQNSVTTIGDWAFEGCSSLESITIPDSVTTIGSYAFYSCSSLKSITIPNSVTTIGDDAFKYCSSLESITIPNSVTTIGNYAFYSCSSLKSITIPSRVTTIGVGAFFGCSSLESIVIPDSITTIGNCVFGSCSSLESITIPNSVTTIGDDAFYSCSNLESITIPNSVTTIGNGAFRSCSSLESITIPNSVTTIGDDAFYSCSNLESITIPNSVTTIGNGAFEGCSSLESITIPNSVTTIGYWTFSDCSSLESITIPNSVTTIEAHAFYNCSSLESITIPNSVTTIGDDAFWGCSSLESITIPNSVTTIGNNAFYNCDNLTVYCNSGSYAETYCIESNIPYKPLSEYPGAGEEPPVATAEWFGKVLSNTTNSITIDINGERTLQVAPGADLGIEMTDNSLQNQYIYGTFDAQNRIVSLKVISPQVGTLRSAGGEIGVEIETDAGLKTYQWYRPSSIPGGLIEWMDTPVQFYADGNKIFLIRSVKTVIGTPTAVNTSSTPATATIDGQSYAIADGFVNSVSKVLNQKALFMLYNDQIEYAKALSTYAPHVDLSVSWNPDRVTYRNDKYDQTALKASVTLTNPSSNFPDGVDLNALKQQSELNVRFTGPITLELSDGNNNDDVGSFLCFGDKYSDPWFGDPKVTQEVEVPQEKTTLGVGDSVTLEVPVSINSKYVPEQGITQKSVNVAVTSLPMTSGSGQTLEMPGRNFDSLVAYYPENIPDETEINDTAKEAAKKLQAEIDKVKHDSQTIWNTYAWNPYLEQIFTEDQLDAIAASMYVKIAIATTPDTDLSDTAKTVLENAIKKHLGIEWLKKPSVGFDSRSFSISSSVFVTSEKYGNFTITFTSGGLTVGSNAKGVPAFATLGDIKYQITTTKDTNTSALIRDGITVYGSGDAGMLTQANLQAFSEVVYEVIKKELIMPYWGEDLNKSVDVLFGKTINKILYYFNQSTASVAITFMEAPGKKYKIECPVDVYVYDSQDNLKGSIVNNQVVQPSEDLSLSVEGDTKYVTIWNNDYKLELKGTDTGTMNITIDEYAGGDVSLRTLQLNNIPLTNEKVYTGTVDQTILEDKSKYNLVDESAKEKEPDSDTMQVQAPAAVSSIQITKQPNKTTYQQGEELDSTGLQVTAKLSDNTTCDVSGEIRLSGYDKNKIGKQTVTVSYLDQTATFEVTVTKNSSEPTPPSGGGGGTSTKPSTPGTGGGTSTQVPLQSIALNTTSAQLAPNGTVQLEVSYTPSDTTASKTVTWTSSDDKVATVDKNGKVTAVSKAGGTATITAKVGDKTATCTVVVNPFTVKITDLDGKTTICAADGNTVIQVPQSAAYTFNIASGAAIDSFSYNAGNGQVGGTNTIAKWNGTSGTYQAYAAGKVGEKTGMYVNGVKLFTLEVTARPFTSDTTLTTPVQVGHPYTFRITLNDPKADFTFLTANGTALSTSYQKNSYPDKKGDYYCTITANKAVGDVGVYVKVAGKTYKVFAARCING